MRFHMHRIAQPRGAIRRCRIRRERTLTPRERRWFEPFYDAGHAAGGSRRGVRGARKSIIPNFAPLFFDSSVIDVERIGQWPRRVLESRD